MKARYELEAAEEGGAWSQEGDAEEAKESEPDSRRWSDMILTDFFHPSK